MSTAAVPAKRHALGLPAGSVRAAHVVGVVALICAIIMIPPKADVLTATATDSDGASGSAQVTVVVNPGPPAVVITAPLANAQVFGGRSVTFAGTAVDTTDGNIAASLQWSSDRDGPVGTAWATALAMPRPGHAAFVTILRPNLPVKPLTLFVNKAAMAD